MPPLSTLVAGFLGVFEFAVAGYMLATGAPCDLKCFPASFSTDPAERIVLLTFTVFLGLLRLQWAVSGRTFLSWLCLIATHACEMTALWSLALMPHFNVDKLPLNELVTDMAQMTAKYDPLTTKVLFAVPSILLFFLMCGPGVHRRDRRVKVE
ncbi:hypothetical protein B484DRAFT_477229 [Ochromonadaceae sp. CCMP2298]|nr:hypothetical protein B484DRAFT_477229 [Ochromonadaceae sp. CCMP2298]|mmetsp:Transcript_17466/g.38733  ORF Transcript_17466/g.38733 Transcript_17466/m.38733 type:complete len:153 (+) Transcript_17466:99-557(+)